MELRRTRIGRFDISQTVTLEQLQADGIGPHLHAISSLDAQHPQ
jgi:hypothetical protein